MSKVIGLGAVLVAKFGRLHRVEARERDDGTPTRISLFGEFQTEISTLLR